MWTIQCNKVIIFTSFLVVLIICEVLVSQSGEEGEEGGDYSQWLMAQVRGGSRRQQEAGGGNSTQLDQAGDRLLQSYLIDTVFTIHCIHCIH